MSASPATAATRRPGILISPARYLPVRLLPAVVQNLLCIIVPHGRLIVQHLIVSILQQLGLAVAQELTDVLLHARIVQLALAGRLVRHELVDGITDDFVSRPIAV